MEEIFETLRKQIKGGFDQNNIIIILDNSISLTCKKHPIPGTNNTISRPINSSTMDKDITKPKMVSHRNVHTAKVI